MNPLAEIIHQNMRQALPDERAKSDLRNKLFPNSEVTVEIEFEENYIVTVPKDVNLKVIGRKAYFDEIEGGWSEFTISVAIGEFNHRTSGIEEVEYGFARLQYNTQFEYATTDFSIR